MKRNLFRLLAGALFASAWTLTFADQWLPVPTNEGHNFSSGTLLADGRILVAGGAYSAITASAEIFNPATDSWASVAPMNIARTNHASVLLPSGDVMVLGGWTGNFEPTASVEVYSPSNDTWTQIAPLSGPRIRISANVLGDGSIFVAGGTPTSDGPATGVTERLFTLAGTWMLGPTLNRPRAAHSATILPDGRVAYIGGYVQFGIEVAEVEILSLDGTAFTLGPSMPVPRHGHLSLYDADTDSVLVLTGFASPDGPLGSIESYSVTNNSWSNLAQLISPKNGACADRLPGGRILIAGGYGSSGLKTDTAEVFEPWSGRTWGVQDRMSVIRAGQRCIPIVSRGVLIVGSVHNDDPNGDYGADLFEGDGTAIFTDGFEP